jgi:hypothetical protein
VVIFIIYIPYLAVLDLERQAPVARDVQAPDALALAGELVSLPERKDPQRFRVFHILQKVNIARNLSTALGGWPLPLSEASYYQSLSL